MDSSSVIQRGKRKTPERIPARTIKRLQLLLGLRGSHTLVEGARCVGVHACVGSASEREFYIPTLRVSQQNALCRGSHLEAVSTTCGSGWVKPPNPITALHPIIDPPATAGGTDLIQRRYAVSRSSTISNTPVWNIFPFTLRSSTAIAFSTLYIGSFFFASP